MGEGFGCCGTKSLTGRGKRLTLGVGGKCREKGHRGAEGGREGVAQGHI